jgi:hypothetical protein
MARERDAYEGASIEDLRRKHAERLRQQQEKLRKAKKDDQLEADWFEDRDDHELRDLLPPDFDQFVPPEVRQRFVAAQREALIGLRGLIDYWLDRSGDVTARTRRPRGWEHPPVAEKPKR